MGADWIDLAHHGCAYCFAKLGWAQIKFTTNTYALKPSDSSRSVHLYLLASIGGGIAVWRVEVDWRSLCDIAPLKERSLTGGKR